MGPLITGVAVILLFSISPIRSVNGLLCLGVVLGGYVAGTMQAKLNGNRLETTRGLLLGARVGIIASLVVIFFDLVVSYWPWGAAQLSGVDYLDPIPKYIYATIYGIYDGLVDIVARGEADNGLEWPGRLWRFAILIVSTLLFGSFGGGVAASTFVNQPTIDEQPERLPETPLRPGHVRLGPGAPIYVQPAREAQIYEPPAPARPAAATGTYAPQPYFDQAAQLQATARPKAQVSVTPPDTEETLVSQ